MLKDILLSFSTFFTSTWIVTYLIALMVKNDWRIERPLRSSIALALLISFVGLNVNLTPIMARWVDSKLPASKPAPLSAEEASKMKNDFLTNLEKFVAQPDQVTPQLRNELFSKFAQLFPNPQQDLTTYFNNIAKFYDCQQSFYEDALQAMKTKKVQKSERRKSCQEADGSFFNRPHMIPDQQAKSDDEVIQLLAKGKKIVREGKEVSVTEDLLKQNIAIQQKNKEILKALFTGGQ